MQAKRKGLNILQCNFEWDPKKAEINRKKHKVRFDHAATVFREPSRNFNF